MQTNQDPNQNPSVHKSESEAKTNALHEHEPTINGADPAEEWVESHNPINVGQNSYNDYLGDENRDSSHDLSIDLSNDNRYRDDLAKEKADKEPAIELGLVNPTTTISNPKEQVNKTG
jgi:hypothetical protein